MTCRQPSGDELDALRQGISGDLRRFEEQPEQAKQLLGVGASTVDATVPTAELAAYTITANVLLNLDEFVTRE